MLVRDFRRVAAFFFFFTIELARLDVLFRVYVVYLHAPTVGLIARRNEFPILREQSFAIRDCPFYGLVYFRLIRDYHASALIIASRYHAGSLSEHCARQLHAARVDSVK